MGIPILIMGRSGSGKTASLRNIKKKVLVVQAIEKPLPFKNNTNLHIYVSNEYLNIKAAMLKAVENNIKTLIIDDAGYLLTDKFMTNHRSMKGNSQFDLYNEIADNFYSLIRFISVTLPKDVTVYVVMHEDINDQGYCKPRTIGKLLDDKVCVEGMFTVVLRTIKLDGKYLFATNTDGLDVTKSPIGMFETEYIDNDLQIVDDTIRNYYNLESK